MIRRQFLKSVAAASIAAFALPRVILAKVWDKAAFSKTQMAMAFDAMGIISPIASDQITLMAPDRAENGAVVQVEVKSKLANTESIMLFVDKNPTNLIAHYQFSPSMVGAITTRIKMADTSNIIAVVKSNGQYYQQRKRVVVLESGCES